MQRRPIEPSRYCSIIIYYVKYSTHVVEEALPIMLRRHQRPVPRMMRMGLGWGVTNLNAEKEKFKKSTLNNNKQLI